MSRLPSSLTTLLISPLQMYFSMTHYHIHHDENGLFWKEILDREVEL
jgi:hypothetical protein